MESYIAHTEMLDNKREDAFVDFLQENKVGVKDLEQAYHKLCGITEEVSPLADLVYLKMKELADDHFPLTRFVKLIEVLDRAGDAITDLTSFLEMSETAITEREKEILLSVVNKKRAREIEYFIDGKEVHSQKILPENSDQEIASRILGNLAYQLDNLTPGEKLTITFTES